MYSDINNGDNLENVERLLNQHQDLGVQPYDLSKCFYRVARDLREDTLVWRVNFQETQASEFDKLLRRVSDFSKGLIVCVSNDSKQQAIHTGLGAHDTEITAEGLCLMNYSPKLAILEYDRKLDAAIWRKF